MEDLLLNREENIHECIQHTKYENLDIIPSYLTLSEAEELMKADVKTPQQFRLQRHLQAIQNEYDYESYIHKRTSQRDIHDTSDDRKTERISV